MGKRIPSAEACALNNREVVQRNLGPLVTRRALNNLMNLSARYGHWRGSIECGVASAECGVF